MSGHGRSCPGDVTWFVRATCVIVGGTGGGTLHRPWSDDVPPKNGPASPRWRAVVPELRGPLEKGLAALGLSLQIACQPGEIGNRGPKTGGKIASLVRRELIDLDASRCRFQSGEVEF